MSQKRSLQPYITKDVGNRKIQKQPLESHHKSLPGVEEPLTTHKNVQLDIYLKLLKFPEGNYIQLIHSV